MHGFTRADVRTLGYKKWQALGEHRVLTAHAPIKSLPFSRTDSLIEHARANRRGHGTPFRCHSIYDAPTPDRPRKDRWTHTACCC